MEQLKETVAIVGFYLSIIPEVTLEIIKDVRAYYGNVE